MFLAAAGIQRKRNSSSKHCWWPTTPVRCHQGGFKRMVSSRMRAGCQNYVLMSKPNHEKHYKKGYIVQGIITSFRRVQYSFPTHERQQVQGLTGPGQPCCDGEILNSRTRCCWVAQSGDCSKATSWHCCPDSENKLLIGVSGLVRRVIICQWVTRSSRCRNDLHRESIWASKCSGNTIWLPS